MLTDMYYLPPEPTLIKWELAGIDRVGAKLNCQQDPLSACRGGS